jgi:hypothetical protein
MNRRRATSGKLAMDLLGFMLERKKSDEPAKEETSEPSAETDVPAQSRTPREKRKSNLSLLPVKVVDKTLSESERVCDTFNTPVAAARTAS